MSLLADFHNHSCLSPCGSLELSPRSLVDRAASKGVRVLALTDHNSSLNCPAFGKLCRKKGLIPIYGLEATTSEEIHCLCLFTRLDAALSFSEFVYSILTPFVNNPEKTGDQVYVDEDDNILGEVEYYLTNAIDLSIEDIGARAASFGGIAIPAHVDRQAFSMTSQLGVIIKGSWAALECVHIPPGFDTLGYPLITSSDAHYVDDVAKRPFDLDIEPEELIPHGPDKDADMAALVSALSRRGR
jgi:hypothetical protein